MRGILLISHGFYAKELKESLKMIAGQVSNLYTACLEATDGPDEFKQKLLNLEDQLQPYDEVLIFADLLGGSPCNTAFLHTLGNDKFRLIAGMNFPMILTALLDSEASVESLIIQGKESIVDVHAFTKSVSVDDED